MVYSLGKSRGSPLLTCRLRCQVSRKGLRFCAVKRAVLPAYSFAEVSDISIDYQINEDIRDSEVRLVDENGEQQGIVQLAVAMRMADERELDLVKIAPQIKPPSAS